MTWVSLGLGSNMNPRENLRSGLDALLLQFRDMALSWVFESEAVGVVAPNFLNMAVGFETDRELLDLSASFKAIEDKHGRDRSNPDFTGRTLDIDILTYGESCGQYQGIVLPRPEIIENAFVLWPLSQIAGKRRHPRLRQSYARLWEEYDKSRQKLWPVEFEWHGRLVSRAAKRR